MPECSGHQNEHGNQACCAASKQALPVHISGFHAQLLALLRRLYENLHVAAGPLAQRAFALQCTTGLKCFAQFNHKQLPSLIRKLPRQLDGPTNTDGLSQVANGWRDFADVIDGGCGLRDKLGCNPRCRADSLQFGQRQALLMRIGLRGGFLRPRRPLEDGSDLLFGVLAFSRHSAVGEALQWRFKVNPNPLASHTIVRGGHSRRCSIGLVRSI